MFPFKQRIFLVKVRKEESGHDMSRDSNFGLKEAGMSVVILGRHLLQESLTDHIAKCSLFSLRGVLTNYLRVRCIIYHDSALHQLFYYILLATSYNKPALSTSKSCGWSLAYQFLSVQHEPWTSFPQEPAARSTPAYLTSTITLGIQHEEGRAFV